jgi:hypothetical protein
MGSSSFTLRRLTDTDTFDVQEVVWNSFKTTAPGVFDTIQFFPREGFAFGFGAVEFHYQFDEGLNSTASRVGVLLQSSSDQPQLSIEPATFSPAQKFEGDMYLIPSGLNLPQGLRLIDVGVSGSQYTASLITSVEGDTISGAVSRATSQDAPTGSILAARGLVVDKGLVTINSGGIGPLVRNEDWGGGLFMSDVDTVSVFGTDKGFLVPSGNVIIGKSLSIVSGSLNVFSGSIYLQGPTILLDISGTSASALTIGQPWMVLTQSTDPVVDVAAGTPGLPDGTAMLVPSASTGNLRELHVRSSGSWFTLITQSFDLIDGGQY